LRENTAAAVLMRSRWPYDFPENASFLDPMCGSGTLVIEAALLASGRSPGMLNDNLFNSQWKGHDRNLIEAAKAWNAAKEKPLDARLFFGIDNDPNALSAARANAKAAGFGSTIKFVLGDSTSGALLGIDTSVPGLAAVNPPYGQRMFKGQRLDELYASLGKALSDALSGWRLSVITEEGPLSRAMRLRPYKSGKISNGAIDCTISLFLLHGKDAKKTGAPLQEISDTEDWEALPGSEPEKADQRDPLHPENKRPFPGTQLPEDLVNRLKKNIKTYAKLASKENVECYRVYDRDLPDYAFAVDIYAQRNLVVQEYSAPKTIDPQRAETRHRLMMKTLADLFPEAKIHEKTRRRQRGADQYTKQSEGGKFFAVNENGLKFYVNFTDYLDTGLFLDHRPLRTLIKDVSAGLNVLNLFSYTASISVCAASGGAKRTVSVDTSNTYCQWAERNFEINDLPLESNLILREDALKYLDECKEKFDIIILDPPTFSNSKDRETILDIQADHRKLVEKCISLLNREGVLYFSTNARRFKLDEEISAKYKTTDISKQTLGFDFERNRRAHMCFKIQRKLM
jgi:23S rRNA (guanine2445-N2)-methyltransferase / 23S rRNA (guanine2069-N7)-methyltransferase